MGKINKLDFSVANLIAAGEVVDRPSPAFKEIIENAVDSGATQITAEIRRGGVSLIRVTDNGCGIDREDLPVSILRHATSKIRTAADLENILTLGFRGEALAAISAVADLKILSRTADSEEGALLESSPGSAAQISNVACAEGTTVIIENIFANFPARQKFLKSDRTEGASCYGVAERLALSHPDISFTFISDGVEKFSTSGDGSKINTLYALYGREFTGKLIEVSNSSGSINVNGFIGNSLNNRANRALEIFFINGRFVRSRTAQAALEEAFSSYMAEGKFPVCALWIDIPAGNVDVNVHPAKLEVKFSNERPVFEAVYYAVRSALKSYTGQAELKLKDEPVNSSGFRFSASDSSIPAGRSIENSKPLTLFEGSDLNTDLSSSSAGSKDVVCSIKENKCLNYISETLFPSTSYGTHSVNLASGSVSDFYSGYSKYSVAPDNDPSSESSVSHSKNAELIEEHIVDDSDSGETRKIDTDINLSVPATTDTKKDLIPIRYVGIVFNTYIIAEREDQLLIIDKHAAHERVLYEEMANNISADSFSPQMLLVPIDLSLNSNEAASLNDYKAELVKAGFEFDISDNSVLINQIPGVLTPDQASDMLISFVGAITDGEGRDPVIDRDGIFKRSLYTAACKAAMKGGIFDGEEHLVWLCNELSRCEDIKVCPHGRAVVTVLSHNYLDRSFGRLL